MSTGINNGKLQPNNISLSKLILFFLPLMVIILPASGFKTDNKWVIVIDAGHGGKDPGAVGSISREKDITLAIALKTGEYIENNIKNVTVIYTRKSDIFPELSERADIANKNKADLFISIHVNKTDSKSVKGTETYIMGITKDQQNLEVAMKENEVILLENDYSTKYQGFDPKSPESYIIFTLTQNIYQQQSTHLASMIQSQYKDRVSRTDRGVKQAGFWVLFMTTMPSVLTEIGFLSNPAEEKYLISKEGQDYISSAIFRACRDYINEIDSKSSISWTQGSDPESDGPAKLSGESGEITFMVQISTSSSKNDVIAENFKGLNDVVEIPSDGRYKYASGRFTEYSDAVSYRKKIESLYPDAFVIAVKENKILPLQQALDQKKKK